MTYQESLPKNEYTYRRPVRLRLIMAAILIVASTLPNLGIQINTFGFYWTFYRLAVVVLALITLIAYRGEVRITGRREALAWMGFLLIWFFYGAAMLVASPYADSHRGLQELLSIMSALLCFYVITGLKLMDEEIEWLLRILFFLLLGLILLGFWEIITAHHLSTSMFEDPENTTLYRVDPHSSAGIMYNVNDFSALLTLMCPVVIGRFRIRLSRCYIDPGWLLVLAVAVINRINDANICNFAIILGVVIYIWIAISGDRRNKGWMLVTLLLLIAGGLLLYSVMDGQEGGLISRSLGLVKDSTEGVGSLHARLLIYRDALSSAWFTGFLGLGPAGFPVYYTANPSDSGFFNPHSFIMEILSQYGLLICLGFIVLLIWLMKRMLKIWKNEENEKRREWGRMGFIMIPVYLVVSFAPSSYILMTLHWTLIALLVLISCTERERGI